jgi:hypothetical protein
MLPMVALQAFITNRFAIDFMAIFGLDWQIAIGASWQLVQPCLFFGFVPQKVGNGIIRS